MDADIAVSNGYDNKLYSIRRGAVALIQLCISDRRYRHGEIVITTCYRLIAGVEDTAPSSRIYLGKTWGEVITELWDKLFDAVLITRQYDVTNIVMKYDRVNVGEWAQEFLTACTLVAHELRIPLSNIMVSGNMISTEDVD